MVMFLVIADEFDYRFWYKNFRIIAINLQIFDILILVDPMSNMTQGEFTEPLLRAHGWSAFPDESKEAKEKFIIGIPGYDRTAPITRQIAANMIQNLKQIQPDQAKKVKLLDDADDWAVQSIQALASQGIVDPDTSINADGSFIFRPKDLLLRQEASVLLDLAFGYYAIPIIQK
ncbi:hypothetical protein IIC_04821 [Bacillus cereus VD021]|uniref:SLH domain-containing protein n=1 Tax=Bacillus cereus VD021 TaxID=1053224 RepID=R8HB05_BACCE|nr:hypothetical protein IIC_04821 [Bacillus cereus VD021]